LKHLSASKKKERVGREKEDGALASKSANPIRSSCTASKKKRERKEEGDNAQAFLHAPVISSRTT